MYIPDNYDEWVKHEEELERREKKERMKNNEFI